MNDAGADNIIRWGNGGPPDFCQRCKHPVDDHGSHGCMIDIMSGKSTGCTCPIPVAS